MHLHYHHRLVSSKEQKITVRDNFVTDDKTFKNVPFKDDSTLANTPKKTSLNCPDTSLVMVHAFLMNTENKIENRQHIDSMDRQLKKGK